MSDNELSVNMSRDFKGIWIPREIWLAEGLSASEKILWAEIGSLYDHEKKGCFASNEYLANFLGVKERAVRNALYKLRQLKLIEDVSFDGRERVIKALPIGDDFNSRLAAWQKNATLHGENPPPCVAEKCQAHIYREQRLYTSIETPPIPPQNSEPFSNNIATIVADDILENPQKDEKLKKAKTPSEFPPHIRELAEKMANALHLANPDWLIPKNLHPMMTQIEEMITNQKRSPKKILDVFMWAINDSFWMDKISKPNPAKYLKEQFAQLAPQMNAKPRANPNEVDRRLRHKDGSIRDGTKEFEF